MKFISIFANGKKIELFAKTKEEAIKMTLEKYGAGFYTKRIEGRLK